MRILLIEDDGVLGAAVRDQIAADGHSVDWVTRLDLGSAALRGTGFDLLLLDLMLPDGRGLPFLRALRGKGDVTPVIILTALDQVSDRIDGLNAGADDWLVKPFDLSELSARIGSVARRYAGDPNPLITLGPLEIDLAARAIQDGGRTVTLTAREWVLFGAFLQRPGQVLSKAQLEERLYAFGDGSKAMRSRSMSAGCARSWAPGRSRPNGDWATGWANRDALDPASAVADRRAGGDGLLADGGGPDGRAAEQRDPLDLR